MTEFNPPELQARVVTAFKRLNECMHIDWNGLDQDGDPAPDCDEVVTEDTLIEGVSLPRTDLGMDMTIGELIDWADELDNGRLLDRREFRSPARTLVYIQPVNELAHAALGQVVEKFGHLEQRVTGKQHEYCTRLVEGMTVFGLKIAEEGSYEKWCPPCQETDIFVEVSHPGGGDSAIASALVDSYLYELQSSLGLQFARARYIEPFDDWDEATKTTLATLDARLRPLLFGPGIQDLIVLFNDATSLSQVEYAILGYTKVIEYVSATVVKQYAHQAIRTRLMSPKALRPDAAFIEGLMNLIEDQRIFQKDSEAIRLTIESCCDAPQLAGTAPAYLTSLTTITDTSKPEERRDALRKLAESVSSTRNQIVHAKTNFSPKGTECPEAQLEALRECLRIAAQQVIRWLADVPESFRILKTS